MLSSKSILTIFLNIVYSRSVCSCVGASASQWSLELEFNTASQCFGFSETCYQREPIYSTGPTYLSLCVPVEDAYILMKKILSVSLLWYCILYSLLFFWFISSLGKSFHLFIGSFKSNNRRLTTGTFPRCFKSHSGMKKCLELPTSEIQ